MVVGSLCKLTGRIAIAWCIDAAAASVMHPRRDLGAAFYPMEIGRRGKSGGI